MANARRRCEKEDSRSAFALRGLQKNLEEVVVLLCDRSKGDATEDLGEASAADNGESLFGCVGGAGVGDIVDNGNEAVGVTPYVSGAADGRGDAVEDDVTEDVDGAGDVADTIGCRRPGKACGGVIAGWVM